MSPFKSIGIKSKIILTLPTLAIIPLAVAGIYGVYFSVNTLENTINQNLGYELSSKSNDIEKFLKTVHKDVFFLSQAPVMKDLVNSRELKYSKEFRRLRERLERVFIIVSQMRPYYYQVRYIDENGYEIVRVDSNGERITAIPIELLQYKGDRYYFTDSIKYPKGVCYVSPMDLNIEWGEVEIPHKPVVRIATPVFDGRGLRRGVVIINLYASYLIEQMQKLSIAEGGTTFLVNKNGLYLSHLNSAGSAGRAFNLADTESLKKDYPIDVVKRVLSGKEGTIKRASEIISYAPIFTGDNISREYWIVGVVYPKKFIFSAVSHLKVVNLIIGICTVIGAVMLSMFIARRLTKPILELHRGVKHIAEGDFEQSLKIKTGDEIEGLANNFNVMVDELKKARERMVNWNRDLQEEVGLRTRELEIEKNKLENVLMCASDGIIVADEEDKIIILNPAAENIFKKSRDVLLGKNIFDCHKNPERVRALIKGEGAIIPNMTTTFDSRQLEISVAVINSGGRRFGSMMVMRDITERQKLTEERIAMERQLLHADKLASIGELSAGIAHEIGNPLAAIKTVIQAMDDVAPFNEEQRDYMERILKEVERLTLFLRTFSSFAYPVVSLTARCKVSQVLSDVVFLVRNEAEKHGIQLIVVDSKDSPDVAMGADQLKQVLINLCVNAIQSMPEGGNLRITSHSVSERNESPDSVMISVSDTGSGIPPENIDKIFDPFFTTKPGGSGLGLSIVQRLIKEYNGEIKLESQVGRGTTFKALLPIIQDDLGTVIAYKFV